MQDGLPEDTETERESTPGVLDPSVTVTPNVKDDADEYENCEELVPAFCPFTDH